MLWIAMMQEQEDKAVQSVIDGGKMYAWQIYRGGEYERDNESMANNLLASALPWQSSSISQEINACTCILPD